jgi:hypothetical protein
MPTANSNENPQLPPLLAYLLEITRRSGERRYAAVLAEFGEIAIDYVARYHATPSVTHVARNDTLGQVRNVARRHLDLGQLEWRLEGAILAAAPAEKGDAIRAALTDVYIARDTAHILWGLSVGLALFDHAARMSR